MTAPLPLYSPVSGAAPAAAPSGNPLAGLRARVDTMGCRVNRYDAAQLRAQLAARGCEVITVEGPYDLFILNTCTVTHQADAEARRLARKAKRACPDAVVTLTGCYAEVSPEAVAAMDEVDLLVGNRDKEQLVAAIEAHVAGRPAPEAGGAPGRAGGRDWGGNLMFGGGEELPDQGGDTRFFLKVQEGCNVTCSFCVIPTARGRSRSMPQARVIETVNRAAEAGYREVILAGIHLGGYGEDLAPTETFAGLLKRVLAETDMPRIRFGSLEPWGLSDAFVELFASEPRLLPSLHVPLQSGSAPVLKRMRRPCTPAFYRRQVERIASAKPGLFLSTDVLVGFPGESDAEFAEGLAFIRSLPFAHLHVFPYSRRRGTPAAELPGQVNPEVRKHRSDQLIALSDGMRAAGLARQVGTVTEVLVERDGHGHTHNNFPIRIDAPVPGGGIVAVRVTGHDGAELAGTPVSSSPVPAPPARTG